MGKTVSRADLQLALDAWESTGRSIERGAAKLGQNYNTYKQRIRIARRDGLKPSASAWAEATGGTVDEGRIKVRVAPGGKTLRVLAIGDAHDSPKLPKDRFRWMGQYAAETRPDWIVQIGDFFTLDSLNSHDDNATLNGRAKPAYLVDMASAAEAVAAFNSAIPKDYKPRKHVTLGNHENRVWKFANEAPEVSGMMEHELVSILETAGWGWSKYGEFFFLGGVGFVHVPLNRLGRPYGGKTAEQQIANDTCFDAVLGHSHIGRQWRATKIGPSQHVTVLNLGCALPDGVIEDYASVASTGWTYGIYDLTIGGGHILSASFIPMSELERRFA
jgi:predicted phosphodiesterase